MNFEVMIQKTVNAEAKVGLKSTIIIRDSDFCYFRGYCPFNNNASKVQTQGTIAKDSFRLEKLKTKNLKSVPSHNDLAKPAKKKDKQKRFKC